MSVGSEQPPHDLPPELRAQVARFRELRERGEHVKEQLAATEAIVRSPNGAVSATVGAGGVLRALELHEPSRRLAPDALSEEIMKTYRYAARQAAEQSVSIMSELVGADSPTLRLLREAIPPDPDATRDER